MNGTLLLSRRIKVSLYSDRDKEFLDNISAESCSEDDQEAHSDKDKENGKQESNKNGKLKPKQAQEKQEKPRRNLNNLIEIKPGKSIPNLAKAGSLERKNSLKKTRGNPSSLITISPLPGECPPVQSTAGDSSAGVGEKFKRKKLRYFAQSINPELGSFRPKENKIKKTAPNNRKFNLAGFKKFHSKRLTQKQNDQQSTAESFPALAPSLLASTLSAVGSDIRAPKPSDLPFATSQFKNPNDFISLFNGKNGQPPKKANHQATKNQPKPAGDSQQSKNHQQPKNHQQNLKPARFLHFPPLYAENNSTSTSNLVNPFLPIGKDANPFSSSHSFDRAGDNPFKKDYRVSRNESKKESDSIDKNPFKFRAQPVKAFGFGRLDVLATDPFPANQPADQPEEPSQEPVLVLLDHSPLPPPTPRKMVFMNTTLFSEADLDDRLNKSIELITLD